MREFESDLERIARTSRTLALVFWSCTLAATAAIAYFFLIWMPQHHVI